MAFVINYCSQAWSYLATNPSQITDADNYQKNLYEKMGAVLTWHIHHLPSHIKNALKNPIVLILAHAAFAHLAIQFGFYPAISWSFTVRIINTALLYIKPWAVKLAIVIAAHITVFGFTLQAIGRNRNEKFIQNLA